MSRLYCRPMIAEGTYAVYVLEYSHTRHEHHRTCQHAAMTSLFMGSLQCSILPCHEVLGRTFQAYTPMYAGRCEASNGRVYRSELKYRIHCRFYVNLAIISIR